MPYKDPQRRKEYKREHYLKNREQTLERRRRRGRIYKRIYDDSNGGWRCYKCGATWEDGAQLDVHHKDTDNSNNDPSNLVCLCSDCHDSLHWNLENKVIPELIRRGVISRDGEINEQR